MGLVQSKKNKSIEHRKKMLIHDKRLIFKYKTNDMAVKLWLKYSKIEDKIPEESEFLRYLECLNIIHNL